MNVSVKDIASGYPFEMELFVSVSKQVYNGPMTDIHITPGGKAKLRRDFQNGDVFIEFDNLAELRSKGILQDNLKLSPHFGYNSEPGYEAASAEVGNSWTAKFSGKEYISLFQISKQNNLIVSFLINNLPNEDDFYYLIILSEDNRA